MKIAVARELVFLLFVGHRHPIFPDAGRRNLDVFREGTELGKCHGLAKELAVLRIVNFDGHGFAGRQRRLIFIQVPRDSFEVNDVPRLVDAALGEKKNGARIDFVPGIVRHAKPIKRN